MDTKKFIYYWVKSAEEDLKTAKSLFISKRYNHCLFFCHLFIEKILKALIVKKTEKLAPYDHSLLRLAESSGLEFSKEQLDFLDDITPFNIRARYDDVKLSFYKKADKEYTEDYFKRSQKMYYWLKKKL